MMSGFSKLLAGTFLATALTACSSFEPEVVACPEVSVSNGAERAYIQGITQGQLAYVRVNGAWPECTATATGFDMELQLGFLMKREGVPLRYAEEVPIDVTFAYIDADDNVVKRYVHSTTVFFPDYRGQARPVLIINQEVPAGTRVVFGLGKAVEGES